MGLKSGSRDSGLEDDEEPDEGTGSEAAGDATDGAEEARDVSASDANSPESVPPTASTTGTGTTSERKAASTTSDSEPTESVDDTERTGDTPESRGRPDTTESRGDPGTANSDDDQGTTNFDDDPTTTDTGSTEHPSPESIPYVLRRGTVNEGRDQVPFFLRASVVDGERELRDELESRLGEDVYKSDYREAAMVVAQEHPELVAEVLRRWGYDL
ncbi:hypothetical protein RYH80_17810 [Halobaculum sp. MBLA0147]|uniref:hypothetical protein n=1 Tax=Halobaculum sp. MBLA0147 TaxID=3079934 RepID=UPI003526A287